LTYSIPLDAWTQSSITATAPAGTESVQWMAFLNNPNYAAGSLFVDDTSLIDNTSANPIWNGGGADSNWTTAANWGGTLPTSTLIFDGNTRLTNNNNFAANTIFSGIQFNSTAGAFVLGGNSVGVAGNVVNNSTSTQTINVPLALQQNTNLNAAAGNINIGGAISGGFSVNVLGGNTVTLSSANSYTGGTTVTAGTLVIGANGALPSASNVSITSGTLQLASNTGGESLSGLSIAAGGSFDLTNNHIFISYADGTQATADSTIRGYLANGYDGGAWNGTSGASAGGGIDTSVLSAHYGIGYADGADGVVAGLSSGQIEVKYTLLGDANLDGIVSGVDFTILVGNLGKAVNSWDQGDFNYDGVVSGTDFTALVGNLGKAVNGADVTLPAADLAAIDAFAAANGLMADVPEPASAGLIVLACLGSLSRRRARRD
jgi:autotransporter-associated beta strand protein